MTISERVSYLKGLAEGLGIDSETKEGKIINVIIDILDDMALELADVDEVVQEMGDEIDAVSDDLADVEEFVFGIDDEDDNHERCCGCAGNEDDNYGDDGEGEEYEYSVECPSCGEELVATESDLINGEMNCPSCGERLEFDFDEEEEKEEEDIEE